MIWLTNPSTPAWLQAFAAIVALLLSFLAILIPAWTGRKRDQEFGERDNDVMDDTARRSKTIGHSAMGQEPKARPLDREPRVVRLHQGQRTSPRQQAGHMTGGRQPFTVEIKTLAKGPSTYDPLENSIRP
jgi:hypothetical protein